MRVLVCGSRTLTDHRPVFAALHGLQVMHPGFTLIEGGARGADSFARRWALTHSTSEPERYPADWERHGRRAGSIRNQQMLRTGVDLVVAFVDKPLEQSRGTAHMVSIARATGVETWVVEVPDGPHD